MLVLAALVVVLVFGTAGPASAHAFLLSTDPAQGAVLEAAPERIRFTFNEAVAAVPDGVQVFDARGVPVASSAAVSGAKLDVTLAEEVDDGTLVVAWRIVSDDGHVIAGSISFSIGAPSADVERLDAVPEGAPEPPRLLAVARWAGYVGLFLAAGLVVFIVLLLPANPQANKARRRLVTTARLGAATAVLGWLCALPLTVVFQRGEGAAALGKISSWASLPLVEYGVVAVVVLSVCLAVGLLGGGLPPRSRGLAAVAAAAVAISAPALTGHTRAASPEVLVVATDVLHLTAGAVWLGGLVALVIALPDLAERDTTAAEVLARFSAVAAGVLAALVVSGSVLAWRILGSWSALLDTGYGQILLAKVAATLLAVAIAAYNRYTLLPRSRTAIKRRERLASARLVVRATAVEAVVLAAVLLLTGLLVDLTPKAATAVAASPDANVQIGTLGNLEVQAELTPKAVGSNTVTIRMTDARGAPTEGVEPPRVRVSSDGLDLGEVSLSPVLPGTYTAKVVLPTAGTWHLQVSLRTSEFTNPVTTLEFLVDRD